MSWEKYRKNRTIRIDLSEIGLEGFYINVRKVKSFTSAEADLIDELRKKASSENKEESDGAIAQVMGKLITGWNLTDPDNEQVSLPTPDIDPKSIKKLPLEVFTLINEKSVDQNNTTVGE